MLCLLSLFFFLITRRPLMSTLFPYTTLFRSPPRSSPGDRSCGGCGCCDTWGRYTDPGAEVSAARGVARSSRARPARSRSEEHTSELQSRRDLVCRLLLEKKKTKLLTST